MNDAANEIAAYRRMNNSKTAASRSFKFKTNIIEKTPASNNTLETEVAVPLEHF